MADQPQSTVGDSRASAGFDELASVAATVAVKLEDDATEDAAGLGAGVRVGKALCAHAKKVCNQRHMDGFRFCIKHILEDPNAPFKQCTYISKRCSALCTDQPCQADWLACCGARSRFFVFACAGSFLFCSL